MYDEATACRKLENASFDPDDLDKESKTTIWHGILYMPHFCFKGDLPMCRFLLSKGVSNTMTCTSNATGSHFPMMMASMGGKLHVCK